MEVCRVGRVFEAHHILGKTLVGLEDSAHPTRRDFANSKKWRPIWRQLTIE
jgi:NADH:ubiquinone oxidoreductase subunit C